jgi:hypothetical protein
MNKAELNIIKAKRGDLMRNKKRAVTARSSVRNKSTPLNSDLFSQKTFNKHRRTRSSVDASKMMYQTRHHIPKGT